ncbi:MAG: AMIN domain-containing protein, partial [Acidobacteria bacterium]|nr:AMIN domain-containing protein [Acidobacteriota bacterium]
MSKTIAVVLLSAGCLVGSPNEALAQSARTLYTRALDRERTLRDAAKKPALAQLRAAVATYEGVARRYPASGYTDNALWQGAMLSLLAYDEYGHADDKRAGLRLLSRIRREYPSSSLGVRAAEIVKEREHHRERDKAVPAGPVVVLPPPVRPTGAAGTSLETSATTAERAVREPVSIRDVKRSQLPDGIRFTIELDGEAAYRSERLEKPRRVFFDLKGARPSAALLDAALKFDGDIVREVRFGRHPDATRIVMDMEGAESYSAFTLYEPFRLVVDFKRAAAGAPTPLPPPSKPALPIPDLSVAPAPPPALPVPLKPTPAQEADSSIAKDAGVLPTSGTMSAPPPAPPATNADGKFSLARQLGLGVSRIVIDAGHGG